MTRPAATQAAPDAVTRDELIAALTDCVVQACSLHAGDDLRSFTSSAHADALRLLGRLGVVRLTHDAGRAVTAVWVKEG